MNRLAVLLVVAVCGLGMACSVAKKPDAVMASGSSNGMSAKTYARKAGYREVFLDSLVGKFNGVDVDTLVALPHGNPVDEKVDWWTGDMYTQWRIHALNGTVDDLIVKDTTGVHFVKEGDLDGDGADEWGYLTEWYIGTWQCYYVYTCVNGKWQPLIKPVTICVNQLLDEMEGDFDEFTNPDDTRHYVWMEDVVRPAKKGYVKTRHCETINEVTEWIVKENTVKVRK